MQTIGSRAKPTSRRAVIGGLIVTPAVLLAGCSNPWDGLPPVPKVDASIYTLGPGDQVRVIVFGDQQLTGEFRVDAAGDIALPLVGTVHAAGLTPQQLDHSVAETLLRSKLYRNPSVSVEVINYRPIFVLGEVSKPGQFSYQPGMTVVTAVAIAGGFTYRAVKDEFSIVRSTNNQSTEGAAIRETSLQPGDVVTVFERIF